LILYQRVLKEEKWIGKSSVLHYIVIAFILQYPNQAAVHLGNEVLGKAGLQVHIAHGRDHLSVE
jgi:hypothetical protein